MLQGREIVENSLYSANILWEEEEPPRIDFYFSPIIPLISSARSVCLPLLWCATHCGEPQFSVQKFIFLKKDFSSGRMDITVYWNQTDIITLMLPNWSVWETIKEDRLKRTGLKNTLISRYRTKEIDQKSSFSTIRIILTLYT